MSSYLCVVVCIYIYSLLGGPTLPTRNLPGLRWCGMLKTHDLLQKCVDQQSRELYLKVHHSLLQPPGPITYLWHLVCMAGCCTGQALVAMICFEHLTTADRRLLKRLCNARCPVILLQLVALSILAGSKDGTMHDAVEYFAGEMAVARPD